MTQSANIEALLMQARTLARRGAHEQAAKTLEQAADAAKSNPGGLLDIARELENLNIFGKAHEVYIKALSLDPNNYIAHSRLAALLVTMENFTGAYRHFREALKIKPDHPDVLYNFALAHQARDDHESALKMFDQALEAGIEPRLVFGSKAAIFEQTNRLDDLRDLLAHAVKMYPEDSYVNFVAAKTARRDGDPKGALAYLKKARTGKGFKEIEVLAHFETGRVFDQMEETDRAYESFQKGNRLFIKQEKPSGEDKNVSLQVIRDYQALDLRDWLAISAPQIEDFNAEPAFLIGFPRSGTTLLHQILDGHPELEVLEEKPHVALIRYQLMQRMDYPSGLKTADKNILASVQRQYLEASKVFRVKGRETKIIEKLPLNIVEVPLILKVFPKAKFILALRHPCDCTLSCFMQNFDINNAMLNFTNLDDATNYYAEVFSLWLKYRNELDLDVHTVRYEDVVSDLEGEAKKVISFLGLEWDESVLDYRKQALAKKRIATPSYHQVVKPIYKDAKGRWTRYRSYLEPYLDRLAPYAKEFDYEL